VLHASQPNDTEHDLSQITATVSGSDHRERRLDWMAQKQLTGSQPEMRKQRSEKQADKHRGWQQQGVQ
jgi:hypothetical protein